MIEIKSYIGSINIHAGKSFRLVNEYHGVIKDPRYIDGAIELVVDGTILISQDRWDLVDQLWIYIINGIDSVINERDYTISFPDSPVKLSFKQSGLPDKIEMTVGERSIIYDSQELANALLDGAENCLKEISRIIVDANFYQEEIQKINQLRLSLSHK